MQQIILSFVEGFAADLKKRTRVRIEEFLFYALDVSKKNFGRSARSGVNDGNTENVKPLEKEVRAAGRRQGFREVSSIEDLLKCLWSLHYVH